MQRSWLLHGKNRMVGTQILGAAGSVCSTYEFGDVLGPAAHYLIPIAMAPDRQVGDEVATLVLAYGICDATWQQVIQRSARQLTDSSQRLGSRNACARNKGKIK